MGICKQVKMIFNVVVCVICLSLVNSETPKTIQDATANTDVTKDIPVKVKVIKDAPVELIMDHAPSKDLDIIDQSVDDDDQEVDVLNDVLTDGYDETANKHAKDWFGRRRST